jgi:UDP-glucuronate decarboxylase
MNTGDDITGPINMGNPGEFTILELAQKIIRLTESKSKIEFRELPKDDPTRRKPDISRAKSVLGWAPKIPLEEGLVKTIEYFRSCIQEAARP